MIQNATLKDCEKKLKRSKYEIDTNSVKYKELVDERNKLLVRLENLKTFCKQYSHDCQKIENNFIRNIKTHQQEQNTLLQQEQELVNLRNDQIKLINNEQIAKNQLMKNKLFLKQLQDQKEAFLKKEEDSKFLIIVNLKVRLQEEIKDALIKENNKIQDGLMNFEIKNKDLNEDIQKLIHVVEKEASEVPIKNKI